MNSLFCKTILKKIKIRKKMDEVGFEPTIIGTYACGLDISPIFR